MPADLVFSLPKIWDAWEMAGPLPSLIQKLHDVSNFLETMVQKKKYYNELEGDNSRLDELQAAILRLRLPKLEANNQAREKVGRGTIAQR